MEAEWFRTEREIEEKTISPTQTNKHSALWNYCEMEKKGIKPIILSPKEKFSKEKMKTEKP